MSQTIRSNMQLQERMDGKKTGWKGTSTCQMKKMKEKIGPDLRWKCRIFCVSKIPVLTTCFHVFSTHLCWLYVADIMPRSCFYFPLSCCVMSLTPAYRPYFFPPFSIPPFSLTPPFSFPIFCFCCHILAQSSFIPPLHPCCPGD